MKKIIREKYPHLYEKYKETNRLKASEYYQKHKKEILAKRKGNKEFLAKKRVYFRQWKKEHKELYDNIVLKWKQTPFGIYSNLKRNASERNIKILFSKIEFVKWFGEQKQICSYCGLSIEQINRLPCWYVRRSGKKRLSIDRKNSQKDYSLDNIVLSCYMCNTIKNSFLDYDDMKKIGDLVIKPKLNKLLRR